MAHPSHLPTPESRAQVEALAGYGITEDDISEYIGVTGKTLRKHYRKELDLGVVEANTQVARSLHKQALDGNVAAAIFWLKSRAGWREKHEIDITNSDGRLTPPKTITIVHVRPDDKAA